MLGTEVLGSNITDFMVDKLFDEACLTSSKTPTSDQLAALACVSATGRVAAPELLNRLTSTMLDLQLTGSCSVFDSEVKLAPQAAAFVNGAASRSLSESSARVAIICAAVAAAEYIDGEMSALLDSVAVGLRTAAFISAMLPATHEVSGWDPAGTAHRMGATAAVGCLLELSRDRLRVALGIAATEVGGLAAAAGSDGFGIGAGKAAFDAVEAGFIASDERFVGVADPVGGRRGFLAILGVVSPPTSQALEQLWAAAARARSVGDQSEQVVNSRQSDALVALGASALRSGDSVRPFVASWATQGPR